jgi:hypothetical protein
VPSYRVAGSTLALSIFDVVGQDGAESGFIGHSGLAESEGSQNAAKIPVLDMGPPLHGPGHPNHVQAHLVGSATLTDDEVQKIRTFIDRHASEHSSFLQFSKRQLINAAPQMYCVHPHAKPLCEDDGRYARMRFSCAGFVFEAYKKARINLLNSDALPMVDIAVVRLGYPDHIRLMENGRVSREDLGLAGAGPWPVLLCGYLFHALNRDQATYSGPKKLDHDVRSRSW